MSKITNSLPDPWKTWAEEVLEGIKKTHPADFARLCIQVQGIESMDEIEGDDESLGLWLSSDQTHNAPGTVLVRCHWLNGRKMAERPFKMILAHELGHACCTIEDVRLRNAPNQQWGEETAADYFVYQWGFAGLIDGTRRNGLSGSHKPGKTIQTDGVNYTLSDQFIWLAAT